MAHYVLAGQRLEAPHMLLGVCEFSSEPWSLRIHSRTRMEEKTGLYYTAKQGKFSAYHMPGLAATMLRVARPMVLSSWRSTCVRA